MNKKYELVMDDTIDVDDATLYRIRALKDFGDVKAGDLGGYIEKESNLGHIGNCWVYNVARVCGDAKVHDNAKVYEHAQVRDHAYMFDSASVSGNAIISGCAMVYSDAQVRDHAKVHDSASVSGGAIISGDAVLYGDAEIFHARINHGATCQKMR